MMMIMIKDKNVCVEKNSKEKILKKKKSSQWSTFLLQLLLLACYKKKIFSLKNRSEEE